jgi:hypothetical protein
MGRHKGTVRRFLNLRKFVLSPFLLLWKYVIRSDTLVNLHKKSYSKMKKSDTFALNLEATVLAVGYDL